MILMQKKSKSNDFDQAKVSQSQISVIIVLYIRLRKS